MKHPFRFSILPYFTMGAGGLGLCLRLWLFSATDEKGLLPAGHPADALLYILSAVVLGILFLATRKGAAAPFSPTFLRFAGMLSQVLGGMGLILTAVTVLAAGAVSLARLAMVGCLLGGLILFYMAILTWQGKALPYWLSAALTVILMITTVAQCQVWGSEPQLQVYFFPLMASVFSILTAYHRTTLAAGTGKRRLLAFFSQGALFFSCLSLNADLWPLYLGLLFWSAAQLIPCYRVKRRHKHESSPGT